MDDVKVTNYGVAHVVFSTATGSRVSAQEKGDDPHFSGMFLNVVMD